jgi:hypothetical protein
MPYSTPEQRRFLPLPGYTVRADFDGGALSSDFGALLLRGIDRQIGFTERLAAAVRDKRHPSYIDHTLRDLFAQRIYHIASGYADGHDANSIRPFLRHCTPGAVRPMKSARKLITENNVVLAGRQAVYGFVLRARM